MAVERLQAAARGRRARRLVVADARRAFRETAARLDGDADLAALGCGDASFPRPHTLCRPVCSSARGRPARPSDADPRHPESPPKERALSEADLRRQLEWTQATLRSRLDHLDAAAASSTVRPPAASDDDDVGD
mmetsp:Transcript_2742/g.10468  ORF Transcript_2742/g.10468 Transcript_2742/m.10468 type:complete len:134 (-) Transcript_2742:90-491(-)